MLRAESMAMRTVRASGPDAGLKHVYGLSGKNPLVFRLLNEGVVRFVLGGFKVLSGISGPK